MLDFVKRICIALALATFIGVLFLGTMTQAASADEKNESTETFVWPTVGHITDTYGTRGGKHYGIDIAAPEGTPVVAASSGIVSRSYYSDTYGHAVFIEHDNGLETVYAHLHERVVAEGDRVLKGQVIGSVGNTGRSSGSHLHFEVHRGKWDAEKSNAIDPLLVLSEKESVAVMGKLSADTRRKINVKRGDTLSKIAREHQVTVEQLMEWNGLTSDKIIAGEYLIVYERS